MHKFKQPPGFEGHIECGLLPRNTLYFSVLIDSVSLPRRVVKSRGAKGSEKEVTWDDNFCDVLLFLSYLKFL